MNRREVVQRLAGSVGAAWAIPGVAASHPIRRSLSSDSIMAAAEEKSAAPNWAPEFLDAHQDQTLIVLAERIVPGAAGAQVNRFIDAVLAVETQESQRNFLASLSAFEAEAISRCHRPFKDITEEQQNAILTTASMAKPGNAGGADWQWFSVPSEDGPKMVNLTLRDHFENLKAWVSGAYYSSELGMKELGWTGELMWGSFPGCGHSEGHE
jgi:hypothetical protein